jgi:hypothetical protein
LNKSDQKDDFIQKYVNLLSRITDAPSEFQIAAALFLLSIAVGRRFIFRSLPETSIFDPNKAMGKILNIWIITLGRSRVSRKTSVLRQVRLLVERVFGKRILLPEAFTPEALISEMSKRQETSELSSKSETICCWICDEIAWFFRHLKKKDSYMISADALLSKLYDGDSTTRDTVGRGLEVVSNPYLVCYLASTNALVELFDELQIKFGFLNRFLFIFGARESRMPLRTQPLTESEKKEVEEIVDFLKALADRRTTTMLELSEGVQETYNSFEEKIENRIEREDMGIKEGYFGNLPNLVIRLSCLYRLNRMTSEEIRHYEQPILTVEKQDLERAIEYAWKAWAWFEKVIEIMKSSNGRVVKSLDLAKEFMTDYLAEKEAMRGKLLCEIAAKEIGCSHATSYGARKELEAEGKICFPKFGYVKLKQDCETCLLKSSTCNYRQSGGEVVNER